MRIGTVVRWMATLLPLIVGTASADQRPDILMIAVDDLRPMLGCYGSERIHTPHIDALARRSVVFDRAYCQYAKCGPSRLSLMTGLRPASVGVFSNRDLDVKRFRSRRSDAIHMSQWLKQQGYEARSFGKIDHDGWHADEHWSSPPSPGRDREMWEIVDGDAPHGPTMIAERWDCPAIQAPDVPDSHLFAGRMTGDVVSAIRERAPGKPFFFAVGYRRPHLPMVAPKRYFDLYHPEPSWLAENPEPSRDSPIMAWFNSDGYVGSARRVGLTMPNPPTRDQAIAWNGYELRSYLGVPNQGPIDVATQLRILQAYAACVSYVDAQVGRLLEELRRSGRLENTLILFWSDHGWHLGEHSAWGKMTNFEIATRVPLLISAPGVPPGRTQNLAELVDLYPTVCELIGLPLPNHLEGESLAETIRNPMKRNNAVARSQYHRFGGKYIGHAVRTDRFRLVRWTETETGNVMHRELYDHAIDPAETRNLSGSPSHANQLERLTRLLGEE